MWNDSVKKLVGNWLSGAVEEFYPPCTGRGRFACEDGTGNGTRQEGIQLPEEKDITSIWLPFGYNSGGAGHHRTR